MNIGKKLKMIILIFALLLIGTYYYVALPAINIHSPELWGFLIWILIIMSLVSIFFTLKKKYSKKDINDFRIKAFLHKNILVKVMLSITIIVIAVFVIGSFLSSPIINSEKYTKLINIEDSDFNKDIEQISYNEIPLLDKSSAQIIGGRKMGTMVEYVSQFEVADDYTQINYKGKPVRVTPLEYGSILKWFTNRKEGIPAYILIDMATQDADCIKLKDGIKYSKSEHFNRYIYRHLRFKYPTYIFDDINMEIDENGTPYWICPVKDYTIGLFGGETISNVVIVNAITGECTDYNVKDVPEWVDHVFSADLLISYYDYYGTLKHGYFNSVLSQKDCLQTTDGYNYIASDDDVWVYTGVTSVGGDESNVGFVLMNQRTGLTRYYQIPGAEEYSAMASAEGKVQNLGYKATFPLFLNVAGEPTYFMSLKDSGDLVKMYAMVNIQKYTLVATANSVSECESNYKELLANNNIKVDNDEPETKTEHIEGTINTITQAVIDGNSHYYILLEGNDDIFDIKVADIIDIIRYESGNEISMDYIANNKVNIVTKIN